MTSPNGGVTENILATRKNAYLGGLYFELRIAFISLAASMEGKDYAGEAIADRLRYLEGTERLDRAFSFMADTYGEPLSPPYLANLRRMIAEEESAPLEGEARLLDFYERLQAPSLAQIVSVHVMLGKSDRTNPVYLQTALLVLTKECLRHGYLPPMIDAHVYHQYRHSLTVFDINSDASLHFVQRAQERTRERAAFYRIEL